MLQSRDAVRVLRKHAFNKKWHGMSASFWVLKLLLWVEVEELVSCLIILKVILLELAHDTNLMFQIQTFGTFFFH